VQLSGNQGAAGSIGVTAKGSQKGKLPLSDEGCMIRIGLTVRYTAPRSGAMGIPGWPDDYATPDRSATNGSAMTGRGRDRPAAAILS